MNELKRLLLAASLLISSFALSGAVLADEPVVLQYTAASGFSSLAPIVATSDDKKKDKKAKKKAKAKNSKKSGKKHHEESVTYPKDARKNVSPLAEKMDKKKKSKKD